MPFPRAPLWTVVLFVWVFVFFFFFFFPAFRCPHPSLPFFRACSTYLLAIVLELTSNSALREVWRANDIRKMAKPIVQVCFFGPTTAHYAADAWVALSRLVYESAELSRYAWLSLDLPTCIHHRMANMEERLQYLSKKRGDVELAHIARIICAMCDLLTETLSTTEVVTKQMMAFLITAGGDERLVLSCGEDVIKFARTYSWLSPSRTRRIFRLEILATIESYLAHRRDLQEEPFAADLILCVTLSRCCPFLA